MKGEGQDQCYNNQCKFEKLGKNSTPKWQLQKALRFDF